MCQFGTQFDYIYFIMQVRVTHTRSVPSRSFAYTIYVCVCVCVCVYSPRVNQPLD